MIEQEECSMLPTFTLDNKTVLVTGGGRGIGRTLAIAMGEAGANVIVVSRTLKDLDETVQEIEKTGKKGYGIAADLTKREDVERMMDKVRSICASLDVVINNAGMNIRTPALEVTDEEWDKIIATNLKSAFMVSQTAAKWMKEASGGTIINMSSVAGHVALRTGVVYGATKAALIQMTKTLALEWSKYNIRVNAIGPWYFKTPLTEGLLQDEVYLNEILAQTPMKRVGNIEELIGPALFLASSASSYVTGQTLFVDGGMTIFGF